MLLELTQNALHCNISNDRTYLTTSDSQWRTQKIFMGGFHSVA